MGPVSKSRPRRSRNPDGGRPHIGCPGFAVAQTREVRRSVPSPDSHRGAVSERTGCPHATGMLKLLRRPDALECAVVPAAVFLGDDVQMATKGPLICVSANQRPSRSVSEGGLEPTSKIVVQASDLHVYRVADRGGSCCSPVVPRCPPLRTASVPNGNSPICNPRGDQVLPCMAVVPGSEGAHLGRRREMGRRALSAVSGAF
jgi:hypothetical protein